MKKEIKQEIIDKTFSNLCFAIVIGSFLYFLNLGYVKISEDVLMTDLKMLGIAFAIIALAVIEKAYRLDDNEFALQGIEIFIASLIVIAMQLVIAKEYPFIVINSIIILCIIAYYIVKSIIMGVKIKKG